jgi:SAM-dependent methyltransferase
MPEPNSSWTSWQEWFYPGRSLFGFTSVDGTLPFLLRIHSLLTPESIVLDFGAGRGMQFEEAGGIKRELLQLRKRSAKVIGIDVSDEIDMNPLLDERLRFTNDHRIPLPDNSVDVVIADWVCEHLPDPAGSLHEIRRVLKREGWFAFRTPNKWHYSMIASRVIPDAKHSKVLRVVQRSRNARDVFPKYYRMNSVSACRQLLDKTGFKPIAVFSHEPEPVYLSFSRLSYAAGVLYQKTASFLPFASLRLIILGFACKS